MLKVAKIILSIVTILFAALGLLKVLAFDVSIPIMLFALATNMILNSVEYKKKNNNSGYIITVVAALFVYVVIVYNVFIG